MDGNIVLLVVSYPYFFLSPFLVFFPLLLLCCCAAFITYRIAFFCRRRRVLLQYRLGVIFTSLVDLWMWFRLDRGSSAIDDGLFKFLSSHRIYVKKTRAKRYNTPLIFLFIYALLLVKSTCTNDEEGSKRF